MRRAVGHLTVAQFDLLRWVAEGCKDGVYEGTSHTASRRVRCTTADSCRSRGVATHGLRGSPRMATDVWRKRVSASRQSVRVSAGRTRSGWIENARNSSSVIEQRSYYTTSLKPAGVSILARTPITVRSSECWALSRTQASFARDSAWHRNQRGWTQSWGSRSTWSRISTP
jgi:hypothetical protein